MTSEDTLRRLSDDSYHAHVQSHLKRVDELIGAAEARVAGHAAHMEKLERIASPELFAVSREVQHNLEVGLQLLLHQRGTLLRELAFIERKRDLIKQN